MPDRPYTLLSCGMSLDGYLDTAAADRLVLSNAADLDRVDARQKDDGDGGGRGLGGDGWRRGVRQQDGNRALDQLCRKCRQAVVLAVGIAVLDRDVAAHDKACVL